MYFFMKSEWQEVLLWATQAQNITEVK
jgi:hypothetical protein